MGAPFDGDGKVFIYRGSDAGIETKPAQVSLVFQLTIKQSVKLTEVRIVNKKLMTKK